MKTTILTAASVLTIALSGAAFAEDNVPNTGDASVDVKAEAKADWNNLKSNTKEEWNELKAQASDKTNNAEAETKSAYENAIYPANDRYCERRSVQYIAKPIGF